MHGSCDRFSQATALTTIRYQAAMRCSTLSGVLDLSKTKITTLGRSAFSSCTGLTGVILPDTLEVLVRLMAVPALF